MIVVPVLGIPPARIETPARGTSDKDILLLPMVNDGVEVVKNFVPPRARGRTTPSRYYSSPC